MNAPLTAKQKEILRYIQEAITRDGFPPSVREIGKAVSLRSPSTVHAHLRVLEESGYIDRVDRKTRAIRVPGMEETKPVRGWTDIPILGRVAAGQPLLAAEDIEGSIPFDTGNSGGTFFGLRVKGDSMIDAGILEGDVIVVRSQETANWGEIVVAKIEDEVTVKRLDMIDGHIWLMPENRLYDPIDGANAEIIGKVCGLYRNF